MKNGVLSILKHRIPDLQVMTKWVWILSYNVEISRSLSLLLIMWWRMDGILVNTYSSFVSSLSVWTENRTFWQILMEIIHFSLCFIGQSWDHSKQVTTRFYQSSNFSEKIVSSHFSQEIRRQLCFITVFGFKITVLCSYILVHL